MERPGAAVALGMVWVCEAICRLFVVRLTQQGVEAIVQTGTEANVSGVAGAGHTAIEVLLWQKLLLAVVSRLVGVVLIQGGQHTFVCVQWTSAIQAACAAVSGHLEKAHNTVIRASPPHGQSSSCCLPPHLVFIQRDSNRQAALAVMSPALQYPLLGFHPLLLHLHTPLALPQPVHILLILQQLGLQLLSLAAQTFGLQEAALLSLLQQALMLALETRMRKLQLSRSKTWVQLGMEVSQEVFILLMIQPKREMWEESGHSFHGYLLFFSGHTLSVPALLLLFQLNMQFLHFVVHFFFLLLQNFLIYFLFFLICASLLLLLLYDSLTFLITKSLPKKKKKKKATGTAVCQEVTVYSRYLIHLEGSEGSELRFFSLLEEEFLDFVATVLEHYSRLPTRRPLEKLFTGFHWIHNNLQW